MGTWFDEKEAGKWPVVGFVDDANQLLAFGSYGTFRARRAYKYSVEHSVYVETSSRGKGLGTKMLMQIIAQAEAQGYHNLIGGIASENQISIATARQVRLRTLWELFGRLATSSASGLT